MRSSLAASMTFLGAAAVVTAGACNMSWFDDDCAITSTCPGDNCPGQCVPIPPIGFDGPSLLWVGRESEVPDCPTEAPAPVYQGYADLDTSSPCPVCECTEPACMFPAAMTTRSVLCADSGGASASYSMPPAWPGTCLPLTPPPEGIVSSATFTALTVRPCEPATVAVPTDGGSPRPWGVMALACKGEIVDTVCNDPALTCAPTATPPPEFRQCVAWLLDGEPSCPARYPDKLTFYRDALDTRSCSECKCETLFPTHCAAAVSFYQDSACQGFPYGTNSFSAPGCADFVPPIPAAGSIKAEMTMNEPGSCLPSGGELSGQIEPIEPRHFCCQPLP
ncbi:MAG: hypothetical protein IT372_14340 [Polyangiaceae bacterium]|nr:hypothetical protein [Polyangiaceae bacterium]